MRTKRESNGEKYIPHTVALTSAVGQGRLSKLHYLLRQKVYGCKMRQFSKYLLRAQRVGLPEEYLSKTFHSY